MQQLIGLVPFPPAILLLAYILDLVLGDPEKLPHPVRWIGRAIVFFEGLIRRSTGTPFKERLGGVILAAVIAGGTYAVSFFMLYLSYEISFVLFYIVSTYMVWTSLSIKSLKTEAMGVVKALGDGGLPAARKRLSRIVGRDTGELDEQGVLRATVETVAENTSDGIIAPLFFLALGGPALMMAYKAINTLDSMVGYKNTRYRDLGWCSARLDDIANFIPARLSGALIACAAFILGYNWKRSLSILKRDGDKHASPNSGMPEAAVAGALGLRLGGPSFYNGVLSDKPFIGEKASELSAVCVLNVIRLMEASALMMAALTFFFRLALIFL